MQRFTAIYRDEYISLINNSSEEIGQLKNIDKANANFETSEEIYQFITKKNKIELFKGSEKIDEFEKINLFGIYKSKYSGIKIKGISSWEGGTKLVDSNKKTLVKLQNESPLVDKGIYEFETFSDVEPYLLMLSLKLHIEGSKKKVIGAVVLTTVIFFTLKNYIQF